VRNSEALRPKMCLGHKLRLLSKERIGSLNNKVTELPTNSMTGSLTHKRTD